MCLFLSNSPLKDVEIDNIVVFIVLESSSYVFDEYYSCCADISWSFRHSAPRGSPNCTQSPYFHQLVKYKRFERQFESVSFTVSERLLSGQFGHGSGALESGNHNSTIKWLKEKVILLLCLY